MARAVLVVLISLLVLVGCGQPGSSVEQQEKNEGDGKSAQQDEPAKSQAKTASGELAKKAVSEPKSKPKREPAQEAAPKENRERVRFDVTTMVARVVDGDTIEISPAIDGVEEVRLIGVDTPETKDPDEGVEPYGPEASTFATDELTDRRVGLEFDVERIDQYDRLLAYVYVGRDMFNEELVEEGYAQAYPYPPNTRYESRFTEAQEEARAGGLGIWGLSLGQQCKLANHGNGIGEGSVGCEVVSEASPSATATAPASSSGDLDCSDFSSQLEAQETLANDPTDPNGLDADSDGQACETSSFGGDSTASPSASATATPTATAGPAAGGGAVPPISEEHCPQNAPIKGNESSGIYHMPGDAYYDATHPEVCFATPQDAEAAGYRAAEV